MKRTADELHVFCDASNDGEKMIYHMWREEGEERQRGRVRRDTRERGKKKKNSSRSSAISSRKEKESPSDRNELERVRATKRKSFTHPTNDASVPDYHWSSTKKKKAVDDWKHGTTICHQLTTYFGLRERKKRAKNHTVPMSSWYVYLSVNVRFSSSRSESCVKISLTSYTFSPSFSSLSLVHRRQHIITASRWYPLNTHTHSHTSNVSSIEDALEAVKEVIYGLFTCYSLSRSPLRRFDYLTYSGVLM